MLARFAIPAFAFLLFAAPQDRAAFKELARRVEALPAVLELTPSGKAALLDNDQARIYRFVRDEVRYEAYRGVLRGATGALLARAGNALDQSALLKEMLEAAGAYCRLARGRLPRETAEKLAEEARKERPPAQRNLDLEAPDLAALGITSSKWDNALAAHEGEQEKVVNAAAETAAAVAGALPLEIEGRVPASDPSIVEDYAWVQVKAKDGWLDLHPALPEGARLSIEPLAVARYVSSLPRELFHWVRLRVFLETVRGGALGREKVFERLVPSSLASDRQVSLELASVSDKDGQPVLKELFRIGNLIMRDEFSLSGFKTGSDKKEGVTALWLEISLLSPAERPRVNTLTLADSLHHELRSGGGWPEKVEGGSRRTLSAEELGARVELIVVTGGSVQALSLRNAAGELNWALDITEAGTEKRGDMLEGFPGENPLLRQWASLLHRAWAARPAGRAAYLDAPAVAAAVYLPRAEDGHLLLRSHAGIVFLRSAASDSGGFNPLLPGLAASYLLHELAFERPHGDDGFYSALSGEEGGKLALVESKGQSEWAAAWDGATALEMEDDLLRGYRVFAPSPARGEKWWRIEPGTADPLARGASGWMLAWSAAECTPVLGGISSGELRMAAASLRGEPAEGRLAAALGVYFHRHVLAPGASPLLPFIQAFRDDGAHVLSNIFVAAQGNCILSEEDYKRVVGAHPRVRTCVCVRVNCAAGGGRGAPAGPPKSMTRP